MYCVHIASVMGTETGRTRKGELQAVDIHFSWQLRSRQSGSGYCGGLLDAVHHTRITHTESLIDSTSLLLPPADAQPIPPFSSQCLCDLTCQAHTHKGRRNHSNWGVSHTVTASASSVPIHHTRRSIGTVGQAVGQAVTCRYWPPPPFPFPLVECIRNCIVRQTGHG